MNGRERGILERLGLSEARIGHISPLCQTWLCKHYYCMTWAWEDFVKLLSVNTVCLQKFAFCLCLLLHSIPTILESWLHIAIIWYIDLSLQNWKSLCSVFIFFKLSVSHSSFFFLSVFFQACQLLLQQQQQPQQQQQQLLQNQRKFTPNVRQQADPQQVHVNTTHHSLLGHLYTSSFQTMTLVFLSCLLSWPGSWLCYSSRGSSRLEV